MKQIVPMVIAVVLARSNAETGFGFACKQSRAASTAIVIASSSQLHSDLSPLGAAEPGANDHA